MDTRRRPATGTAGIRGEAVFPGARSAPRVATDRPFRPSPGRTVVAMFAALVLSGFPAAPVPAQEPDARLEQPDDAPPLSARYRFSERYSVEPDAKKPDALTQYQVGSRETVKVVRDRPQGAPDRVESNLQMIYTERAAKVTKEAVSEVVRHYDRVNFKTTLPMRPFKTKWLEGMTILLRLSNQPLPTVVSLTDRAIRQQEFARISQQTFVPGLRLILPRKPSRVGDTWPISKPAILAMIGAMPVDDDFNLMAELIEVHKSKTGPSMTAVIGVKGQFSIDEEGAATPTAINAQIDFAFEPAASAQDPTARPGAEATKDQQERAATPSVKAEAGLFEGRGFVSRLRLAQATTLPLEGESRLKQSISHELFLERRIPGQSGGSPEPGLLPLPEASLSLTPANSWLLYDDPQGRFHFLHPQELRVVKVYPEGGVDLLDRRPDGQDVLQITLVPKTQDPERDRLAADPIQQKKLLEDEWKRRGEKVKPGPSGYLNDPELARLNRKVYRTEAALIPTEESDGSPTSGRIYLDHYIVLFSRNEVLKVTAMTTQDQHSIFSKKAETVIKRFNFGSSEAAIPSTSTPAPAAGPSTTP